MAIKNRLITGANFRDFDWNKAKLFYHIVKCGSYIKAAEIAGTDQPALTRQMQGLEEQLGCPLLIRKPGFGIALTRRGEDLYKMVEPFFAEVRGFCGETYVEVGGEKKRKIRIAATSPLINYVINELVLHYSKQNPHLVFETIGDDGIIDIILSDLDIAIRPYSSKTAGIQQEFLFTLQKKLYASEEYLEKYGEPQTVEDLRNHHLIAIGTKAEEYPFVDVHWILELGMSEGEKQEPVFLSNTIEARVEAAKKGIGIISGYEVMSIIRRSGLKNILSHVADKPLEEYFTYPDYLKEDEEIMKFKNYIYESLFYLQNRKR